VTVEPTSDVSAPAREITSTREVLFLVLLSALVFLSGLGATPLWEPDEPRFAGATREMMRSGDYLSPSFNARPRWEKPILLYWMQAAGSRLPVREETAARLPSALAGIACVLGVCLLGRLWWSSAAGLLAGAMLATSFRFVTYARQGLTDVPAVAGIVLTLLLLEYAASSARNPRRREAAWWGGWLLIGLTALMKGPLAAIAPLVWVPVALIRRRDPIRLPRLLAGALLASVVGGSWYCYMLARHGRAFVHVNVAYEVVSRYADAAFSNQQRGPLFYWQILPGEIAPWTLLAAAVVYFLIVEWRRLAPETKHGLVISIWWFVVVMAICSLSRYKLPHYSLPAYPALFLVAGFAVDASAPGRRSRSMWGAVVITAAVMAIAAIVIAPELFASGRFAFRVSAVVIGVSLFFAGEHAVKLTWRGHIRSAVTLLAAGLAVTYGVIGGIVLPRLVDLVYPYPSLGTIALQRSERTTRLCSLGVHTALVFYADRPVEFLPDRAAVAAYLNAPEPRMCVLQEKEFRPPSSDMAIDAEVLATKPRLNPRLNHWLSGRIFQPADNVLLVANRAAVRSGTVGAQH
jgi:4-amino-4-deoxy-L-arabinose transferase-like glycosyltransferase